MLRCLECGREVASINYQHLRSCCGLTTDEYRARHPDAPFMAAEVRAKVARPGETNGRWRGRSNRRCRGCGATLARNTRGDRCAACREWRAEANPFFGRQHSPDSRLRMRASARQRDRSTYRGGRASPERLSAARRNWWAAQSEDRKSELLASFIVAGQRANKRSSKTRIEVAVAGWLRERGVTFQQNVKIGRYVVDFVVGGTVILECYGDFWHCNPALYESSWYNKSLHMTAAEKWARDAARLDRVCGKRYDALVLWEGTIRDRPEDARHAIDAFLMEEM